MNNNNNDRNLDFKEALVFGSDIEKLCESVCIIDGNTTLDNTTNIESLKEYLLRVRETNEYDEETIGDIIEQIQESNRRRIVGYIKNILNSE